MTKPEFSRPFRMDTLGGDPRAVTLTATPEECAAVAERFGLLAIEQLVAEATLTRSGDVVTAVGALRARVTQACVASGEPVPATVAEPFTVRFVPDDAPADEDVELDADDLDVMMHDGGAVDLGEAVAQTLALALDPFPRAPGAADALRAAGVLGEGEAGPFGALKALRDTL